MSLDLHSIRASVTNFISKNNTTTSSYNVSSGLSKKLTGVIAGYHKSPRQNINLPYIWVELKRDREAFDSVGQRARRKVVIEFDIIGEVNTGLGQYSGRGASDTEMIKLAQNVKNLLRSNPTLSSTAYNCLVTDTEYDLKLGANDTYDSIFRISLECEQYSL